MSKMLLLSLLLFTFPILSQESCPILPRPVTFITSPDNTSLQLNQLDFNNSSLSTSITTVISQIANLYLQNSANLVTFKSETGTVTLQRLTGAFPESYTININKDGIKIAYTSEASCLNAIHSLFQLIESSKENNSLVIPCCFVKDYPSYTWRGLHLDVSRHFFNVSEVKRYLDLMSMYKFNIFHWHLTDDQGWRIEIKKYPKLTSIGAWRDSTVNNHYSTHPRTWNTQRYGGFYTQEEIKEVVSYAASRHITIVPEIEMPGHARAALAAYPEYSCTGIKQGVPGLWGVFDDVFCTKDSTLIFLQNILDEVMQLFPGPYIHVGGDEVPKTRWKKCSHCQQNIKAHGLANEHELQSFFIGQMDQYLQAHNRKLIGWDEILEGGLSPGAAVMSWRGTEGGIAAAKQNHYVVMSPGSHCYFDHYQGKSANEPLAIGGYTPLEKVYEYPLIPSALNVQEAQYILGGQGNLWTEYIPTFDQLTYMTYPRAIALSQVLWGGTKAPYSEFEKTLKTYHIPRLSGPLLNTNISFSFMKPSVKFKRENEGISLQFEMKDTNSSVMLNSDESNDNITMNQSSQFDINRTTKKSKVVNFTYSSSCCKDSITVVAHQGLGAKIEYVTKPNSRYNSGDLTLVDGQFGARPWRGYQWVGYDTNLVEIKLNFDRKIKFTQLELGFLNEPSSWIHLPTSITILTSSGKKKYVDIQKERNLIHFKAKSSSIQLLIQGQKLIPQGFPGEGNKPWLFLDEIIIR